MEINGTDVNFEQFESAFILGDCIEGMRSIPDNYFDLAIVDPPYGGGNGSCEPPNRFGGRFAKYAPQRTGGTWAAKFERNICAWDVAPPQEYFDELFRVSKNQIIWGGNYFRLPPCRCFVVWDKVNIAETFSMAMCEYAWTSFAGKNAKIYRKPPQDPTGARFHPTQKPVDLYLWLISRYAKPGDKILDTHAGSASCLIAAHQLGHKFLGFEIDEDYYTKAKKRLDGAMAQKNIFDFL